MAIAPTDAEARDIAQRGMEGLIRRTRDCHRFDHLVLPPDECEAAQGPLRAIIANMDIAIEFGAGTPDRIADNLSALLADGMADYVCLMFPAGDMTIDESRRTLELFVSEVQPQLAQSVSAS
jgi:alkanesulfonate monooxygenase SsuD/methylene tetrahydromethanopterin reductase-like flavin-dependent oxidoreductase (luciferase family)